MIRTLVTVEISLKDEDEVEALRQMLDNHRNTAPFGNGVQLRIDRYPVGVREMIVHEAQLKRVAFE